MTTDGFTSDKLMIVFITGASAVAIVAGKYTNLLISAL